MIPEFYETWHIAPKLIILLVFMVVGVFFLVKFCDLFVGAASSIAKKLKIAPMIIGLTVVAMGTSCPELAVSVSDSISCLINGGYANVA
jgi:cation:H+ antiporter